MLKCPFKIPCVSDDPFANLSSETPDVDVFIASFFPAVEPPLGQTWTATGCVGVCTSTISQEDANFCAARQSAICQHHPPPVPVRPPIGGSTCSQ